MFICQAYLNKTGREGRIYVEGSLEGVGGKVASPNRTVPLFPGRLHGGPGQAAPHSDQGLQSEHRHQLRGVYS